MSMNPNKLALHRQVDYIPVQRFTGLVPTLTALNTPDIGTNMQLGLDVDTAAAIVVGNAGITAERMMTTTPEGSIRQFSLGTGFPYLTKIGGNGIAGLLMAAADDNVHHFMRIPNHWDRRNDILFRVVWTSASATIADTVTWKLLYFYFVGDGASLVTPSVELDTVIPVLDAVQGNKVIQITGNGVLKGGTFLGTSRYFHFLVAMSAFAAGLDEDKWLVGLEVEYTPRLGRSIKSEGRAFQVGQ